MPLLHRTTPAESAAVGYAARHLERQGYAVLEKHAVTRWGVIDLIAHDDATLVFVDLTTRPAGDPVRPPFAPAATKRRAVRRAAAAWLAQTTDRPTGREVRFDAIEIRVRATPTYPLERLGHVEHAY